MCVCVCVCVFFSVFFKGTLKRAFLHMWPTAAIFHSSSGVGTLGTGTLLPFEPQNCDGIGVGMPAHLHMQLVPTHTITHPLLGDVNMCLCLSDAVRGSLWNFDYPSILYSRKRFGCVFCGFLLFSPLLVHF